MPIRGTTASARRTGPGDLIGAIAVAAIAVVRCFGLEDEEGEGIWKPAAGVGSLTLAADGDRKRLDLGKLLVSLARVCALEYVCTCLAPSASIGFTRYQSP